jgi:hypothetical protein
MRVLTRFSTGKYNGAFMAESSRPAGSVTSIGSPSIGNLHGAVLPFATGIHGATIYLHI